MADTVRHVMEEMVPELEDLESRGYFTKAELRSITKKRTDFEYKMKRRSPKLSDYLKYAEYEMALEDLRKVRRRLIGSDGKRTLADYCITRRVHFIFERATRKFRGDLGLWSKWLDFCTHSRSSRMTSRVLAKALRLHPTVPGLWGRSAAWEFDHKRDASSARKLLQRGLRMCPKSETLWVEYFRFELLYASQLRARRAVLGIPQTQGAGAEEENAEAAEAEAAEEAEGEPLAGEAAAVDALLRGGIAAAVMNKARAAFQGSTSIQRRMLLVLDEFEFDGKEAMEESLLAAVREACGDDSHSWDLLARRAAAAALRTGRETSGVEAGSEIFEEALTKHPTALLFAQYAAFVKENLDEAAEISDNEDDSSLGERAAELAQHLLSVYRRASEAGLGTRESVLSWLDLARRCGLQEDVIEAASAAALVEGGCGPELWGERLALASCAEVFGQQVESLRELARRAMKDVPASDDQAPVMWLRALEALSATGDSRALASILGELELQLSAMAKGPLRGGMGAVAAAAVEVTTVLGGLPAARKLYKRLLALPPAGGSLFHHLLDLEISATAAAPSDEGRECVKQLFESAAEHYGQADTQLWLRFVAWEQGGSGGGTAYWRAVKALADPAEFTAAHQQSVLG